MKIALFQNKVAPRTSQVDTCDSSRLAPGFQPNPISLRIYRSVHLKFASISAESANVPKEQSLLGSRCCPEVVNLRTEVAAMAPTSGRGGNRMD